MKRQTTILLILILFSCCKRYKEFQFSDHEQEKDIYSLINDLLIDSIYQPDLITIEAMSHSIPTMERIENLKPPGYIYTYNVLLFDTLFSLGIIDSVDVQFLKKQITKPVKLNWDPKQIKVRTCQRDTIFKKIMEDNHTENYESLEKEYGAENFLTLSIPLISQDKNTVIIAAIFACGWTCGEGVEYVFRRINGKWKIIYRNQGFIS
jgi:hypothetical protein